jgi:DNA repair protein RecO (recombination protein O)
MKTFSTSAFLIRKVDYGEADRIVTLFTRSHGKVAAIAKFAKKSSRRFGGVLELFSEMDVVCRAGKRGGMLLLQEASLQQPFSAIRSDVVKTAYASYWADIVHQWMESEQANEGIFDLMAHAFAELDRGKTPAAEVSILFQLQFLAMHGLAPNLEACATCGRPLEAVASGGYPFFLEKGGVQCPLCSRDVQNERAGMHLSMGTVMQLRWVGNRRLPAAARIRFTNQAVTEGLRLLEAFVPFHLDRSPKSLKVLRQLRDT